MRCDNLYDSGPYVLGALSPPERDAYERHLAECPICREEVADMAALPGLLGRIDLMTAKAIAAGGEDAMHAVLEALPGPDAPSPWAGPTAWAGPTMVPDPPAEVPQATLSEGSSATLIDLAKARKRREQRRRRWQTAGAALVAACLAVLAVFGVRATGVGGGPRLTAMQQLVANSPVQAQLAVESVADGTEVHMHCTYKDRDGTGPAEGHWTFRLVAVPKSGEPLELNEWTATYGDEYTLTGHTKLARQDLDRLEIRRADGTPVLSYNVKT